MPKLKILNIAHNPIITPPKDIIALGCLGILNYLRTEWNKLHPDEPVVSVERKNLYILILQHNRNLSIIILFKLINNLLTIT